MDGERPKLSADLGLLPSARNAQLNPFGVELVSLGTYCAYPHTRSEAAEKAQLLLNAAVARARLFAGTQPQSFKTLFSWDQKVTRRSLFRLPPLIYEPVPAIRSESCVVRDGCRVCATECPRNDLSVSDRGDMVLDKRSCTGCGACLSACPRTAIEMPGWSPERVGLLDPADKEQLDSFLNLPPEAMAGNGEHSSKGGGPFGPQNISQAILSLAQKLCASSDGSIEHLQAPLEDVTLGEGCTACEVCATTRPTKSLVLERNGDELALSFDPQLCIGCGQCRPVCPEGIVNVKKITDFGRLSRGRCVMHRAVEVRCKECGGPVAPGSMLRKVAGVLGSDPAASLVQQYCSNCRGNLFISGSEQSGCTASNPTRRYFFIDPQVSFSLLQKNKQEFSEILQKKPSRHICSLHLARLVVLFTQQDTGFSCSSQIIFPLACMLRATHDQSFRSCLDGTGFA